MISVKNCTHCKNDYGFSSFQLYKGKPSGWCRKCRTGAESSRRAKKGIKPRKLSRIVDNTKLCMECEEFKGFTEFSISSRGLGGIAAYCKPCLSKRFKNTAENTKAVKKYRISNRAVYLAQHRCHQFKRKNDTKITDDGTLTKEVLYNIYDTNTCFYCKKYTEETNRTLDHKIPLSRGGKHSVDNAVMACQLCNSTKSNKTHEEFINANRG